MDIAMMILELNPADDSTTSSSSSSLPLPKSCVVVTRSRFLSSVTCSAVLTPGHYAVLPFAFRHWHNQAEMGEEVGDISYVLAMFSARSVDIEGHRTTHPGFMAESIFLLAEKFGKVLKVC